MKYPCAICDTMTLEMVTIEGSNVAVCDAPGCQFLKEYEDDDSIDGRYLGAVNEYASTCDGCAELALHESMIMDPETQLGYCESCVDNGNIPDSITKEMIEEYRSVEPDPTSFDDIAKQIRPESNTSVLTERVVFVKKGPEMTPLMGELIGDAILDSIKQGTRAINSAHPELLPGIIEETLRFIETQYLGTNKLMLKNYEQAAELKKAGNLIETSED